VPHSRLRKLSLPSEMHYHLTAVDNALNQREQARIDKVLKDTEKWTTSRSVATFGKELVTETARLLMNGKTVSGRWLREVILAGSKQTFKIEQSWNLSGRDGCFCLTFGNCFKRRWHSVGEFVDFFADKNDKEMTAFFVYTESKSTDEICKVEGTLQRTSLEQLAGAGYSVPNAIRR